MRNKSEKYDDLVFLLATKIKRVRGDINHLESMDTEDKDPTMRRIIKEMIQVKMDVFSELQSLWEITEDLHESKS